MGATRTPRWETPPGAPEWPAGLQEALEGALAALGDAYEPRTHNRLDDGGPRWVNRLLRESSPYLLQHAHNPVDWHPWGDEAFALARRLDRPVLLSIGYSTCHWCHVMEVESFEDPEVAEAINRHYVAIKVDREQRPDVDAVYMAAVQMMTGQGGWPMTTVLDHERRPFFGGTYFPARDGDRGAMHGFLSILEALHRAWTEDRARVVEHGRRVAAEIRGRTARTRPGELPDATETLGRLTVELAGVWDATHGGFGGPPKFPQPSLVDGLLVGSGRTGDHQALAMAMHTLRCMAGGGVRDHVGGGFHRYAVDGRWLVPHFEKMLYDNAQLASTYLAAWQASGERPMADVAADTLDYLVREMRDPRGGVWSATDADSLAPGGHLEEGWFFTWAPAELREALGPHAELVEQWAAVTEDGNFEGRNILHEARPVEVAARLAGVPAGEAPGLLRASLERLREWRARRPAPLLDDKVLAAWNGLAIAALARGALLLGDGRWLEAARGAAAFADETLRRGGTLQRCARGGEASHTGLLDDHAFLGVGCAALFEATGEARWLRMALGLAAALEERFRHPDGGYAMTPDDGEALLAREVPTWDGAEPSGNSMAALLHARLYALTGDEQHRARAERTLRAFAGLLRQHPSGVARMVTALDAVQAPLLQIVVARPAGAGAADRPLLDAIAGVWLPEAVVVRVEDGAEGAAVEELCPWTAGKGARGGPTAWVCEEGACQAPTSDPRELAGQLAAIAARRGR